MEFDTEILKELVFGGSAEGFEVISEDIVETDRWSILYLMIFKTDNRYFSSYFRRGATEYQDESPYDGEGDKVRCIEVFPTEVKVIKYLTKEELEAFNSEG